MHDVPLELSLVTILFIRLECTNHNRDLPLLFVHLCVFFNKDPPPLEVKNLPSLPAEHITRGFTTIRYHFLI